MKIIKLDGRFSLYREYNFPIAVKYNRFTEAHKLEQFLKNAYGSEYLYESKSAALWRCQFAPGAGIPRPYYVGLRDQEMLMMATLAGVL